jgi:dTDP-glucose 4,6-dehydratase/UDP-glucose 4-epimerase
LKILILGSEGFIGSHCATQLLAHGFEVTGCDLYETSKGLGYAYHKVSRLSPQWDEVFSSNTFDVCINAAGSGNVPYSMQHPLIDFESNTLDVLRVLDAIRRYCPRCRYLHISSAAVYGNPDQLPVNEQAPTRPLSAYGWHKLMSEHVCAEYHQVYKINTTVIRPFSVYGAGLKKQLLWDICQKIKNTSATDIMLFGTGEESRDFIYIDDLIQLIRIIIESDNFQGNVYNAASGVETKIKKIAEIIHGYFPSKKISFSGQVRIGDPINWRADISKVTNMGFNCKVFIQSGIEKYINWFNHQ